MKEKILIIDDDNDDIQNFKDHFNEMQGGYEIVAENDFGNTIHRINEIKDAGDKVVAVFVDLIKKIGSERPEVGLQVIPAIKEKYDDIFIIAYTQHGIEYAKKATDEGAHWFLQKQQLKTLTLRDLKKRLEDHVREHTREQTQYKDFQIDIFLRVLDRIHNSMTRITNQLDRYEKRAMVFEISDEYDLQDLFWTILKPIFPEMNKEVPMPQHMGKSSRADFYLPEIKTILELKCLKTNAEAKAIPTALDNDVTWYGELRDAQHLVFYVLKKNNITFDFEPTKKKLNQSNFLRDSKKWEFIKCFIRPD